MDIKERPISLRSTSFAGQAIQHQPSQFLSTARQIEHPIMNEEYPSDTRTRGHLP